MINNLDCVEYLLRIEPEFKPSLDEHLKEWGKDSNLHSQMSEFSSYITGRIKIGPHIKNPVLFNAIEHLLEDGVADDEVQNAICTCFLENLINRFSEEPDKLSNFIPLLGEKSREYCRWWDEFWGVQTPGLWDDGKFTFNPRKI